MAFRREKSPNDSARITLKELSGNYKFYNVDTKETFENGSDFTIKLPNQYSCVLFKYSK